MKTSFQNKGERKKKKQPNQTKMNEGEKKRLNEGEQCQQICTKRMAKWCSSDRKEMIMVGNMEHQEWLKSNRKGK